MANRNIVKVAPVGFMQAIGGGRSPESLPFPSCMASLMEALGEKCENVEIHAHDRTYIHRTANDEFLAASGMAFGLLFDKNLCMSSMDVMQVNDHAETIRRAFMWAGYEYVVLEGLQKPEYLEKIRASIDAGSPVLAFGLFDIPECAIVCGYSDDALIGYSHFQNGETVEDGMFLREGWENEIWKFIVPVKKTERSLTQRQVLEYGLEILNKTQIEDYLAGDRAYEEWIARIRNGAGDANLFSFHRNLLFNLAELRCWGSNFLKGSGALKAAKCFSDIHDLCWKADAATNGEGEKCMESLEAREAIANVLCEIREKDRLAAGYIEEWLK